jgi:hypothetical protein
MFCGALTRTLLQVAPVVAAVGPAKHWYFETRRGLVPMDQATTDAINQHQTVAAIAPLSLAVGQFSYVFDLVAGTQVNTSTQKTRKIQQLDPATAQGQLAPPQTAPTGGRGGRSRRRHGAVAPPKPTKTKKPKRTIGFRARTTRHFLRGHPDKVVRLAMAKIANDLAVSPLLSATVTADEQRAVDKIVDTLKQRAAADNPHDAALKSLRFFIAALKRSGTGL